MWNNPQKEPFAVCLGWCQGSIATRTHPTFFYLIRSFFIFLHYVKKIWHVPQMFVRYCWFRTVRLFSISSKTRKLFRCWHFFGQPPPLPRRPPLVPAYPDPPISICLSCSERLLCTSVCAFFLASSIQITFASKGCFFISLHREYMLLFGWVSIFCVNLVCIFSCMFLMFRLILLKLLDFNGFHNSLMQF